MKSSQFHSIPQNPQIIKPISRGAFGRVFLARKRATGDVFAIKCILRKLWSVKLKGTWTEEKYNVVLGLQEWKAEFDSVFNKSRHTFSYGSPDIVPILCGALPHSTWNSYPHEYEDFATDASFLDEWSFDQFESIVNKSKYDPKLKQLIHEDHIIISLHLLGCDSNGHAHRPYSSIYLNNVKVVDRIAEGVYNLLENYFKDNQTTYILTADHGMSDKGSHADGHWSLTDTPLVAWGAGVKHPRPTFNNDQDNGERFVDEHHMHDTPTPTDWGLSTIERADVNQADIAPLMVVLEVTIIFDIQISDAFSSVDISIPQARARLNEPATPIAGQLESLLQRTAVEADQ